MSQTPQIYSSLTLEDKVSELGKLTEWVASLAERIGAGKRDKFRFDLAVTEAVTNVIMHGLPDESERLIRTEASFEEGSLAISIIDSGIPFDPLTAPVKERPTSLAEATPGGAGLLLIRAYCDDASYEYSNGENRLTLIFQIKEAGENQSGASS
ncbi:MAG: ATP-binding protein [Opitutaceae bacterium]|nr:ATP-binding protein [Opitutaceae bacterium]